MLELLRGMMRNARILILDEPTSSLTFNECSPCLRRWRISKKKGIAIIYITHRLTEVFEIATHVAIMRDGVIALEGPVGNFTKEMLIQGLLPNDAQSAQQAEKAYVPVDYAHLKPVMQVKDFSGYGFSNITSTCIRAKSSALRASSARAARSSSAPSSAATRRSAARSFWTAATSRGLPPRRFCRPGINLCRKTATTTAFQNPLRFLPTRPPRCSTARMSAR